MEHNQAYLMEVKFTLRNEKEKYNKFLGIFKSYKKRSFSIELLIEKVKEVLEDYPELLLGFNAFLPQGYEITIDMLYQDDSLGEEDSFGTSDANTHEENEDDEIQRVNPVGFEDAVKFVNKVKKCFPEDDRFYMSFLDIINENKEDVEEILNKVCTLFSDHPDLLSGFIDFLPDISVTSPTNQQQQQAAGNSNSSCKHKHQDQRNSIILRSVSKDDHKRTDATLTSKDEYFQWEEDMFQMDLVVEWAKATRKSAMKLWDKISKIEPENHICIEDHFTAMNLSFIRRLYGEYDSDVMDALRTEATTAVPVLLIRLKKTEEAVSRLRMEFIKKILK